MALPVPHLAGVHGDALGGGQLLQALCILADLALLLPGSHILLPVARVGQFVGGWQAGSAVVAGERPQSRPAEHLHQAAAPGGPARRTWWLALACACTAAMHDSTSSGRSGQGSGTRSRAGMSTSACGGAGSSGGWGTQAGQQVGAGLVHTLRWQPSSNAPLLCSKGPAQLEAPPLNNQCPRTCSSSTLYCLASTWKPPSTPMAIFSGRAAAAARSSSLRGACRARAVGRGKVGR